MLLIWPQPTTNNKHRRSYVKGVYVELSLVVIDNSTAWMLFSKPYCLLRWRGNPGSDLKAIMVVNGQQWPTNSKHWSKADNPRGYTQCMQGYHDIVFPPIRTKKVHFLHRNCTGHISQRSLPRASWPLDNPGPLFQVGESMESTS